MIVLMILKTIQNFFQSIQAKVEDSYISNEAEQVEYTPEDRQQEEFSETDDINVVYEEAGASGFIPDDNTDVLMDGDTDSFGDLIETD